MSLDQLSIELKQLKKSQAFWGNLLAPRLGELRSLIDTQERMIEQLTRRIEALETTRIDGCTNANRTSPLASQ